MQKFTQLRAEHRLHVFYYLIRLNLRIVHTWGLKQFRLSHHVNVDPLLERMIKSSTELTMMYSASVVLREYNC